jgi:hypothetical protein
LGEARSRHKQESRAQAERTQLHDHHLLIDVLRNWHANQ